MRITLGNTLPPYPDFVEGIRRAPDRGYTLTPAQTITALKNALRYIPPSGTNNWLLNLWKSYALAGGFTDTVSVLPET